MSDQGSGKHGDATSFSSNAMHTTKDTIASAAANVSKAASGDNDATSDAPSRKTSNETGEIQLTKQDAEKLINDSLSVQRAESG